MSNFNRKNLILLHGALGASSELRSLATKLNEHFDVHVMEFQGHGVTPSKDVFSITAFAEQLQRFIDGKNLKGAAVFGFSMGGYVALYLATQQPELMSRIVTLGTKFHWTPESAALEIRKLNPMKIQEKVPKFAAYLAQLHGESNWQELMQNTANMMLELGNNELLENRFSLIQNPCFIGLGDSDDMVTIGESIRAVDQIPQAKFYSLEDTPHPINRVDLDRLGAKLCEFLKGE